ncbi:MAG: hypothetical protein JST92_11300 [Deltaproteobacteria bacterium]|nr:hypothetical protein [Deltaproteobacteria bacterium]
MRALQEQIGEVAAERDAEKLKAAQLRGEAVQLRAELDESKREGLMAVAFAGLGHGF